MGAEVIKVGVVFTYGHQPRRGTAHLPGRGALSWGEPGERPWNRTAHYVHRNGNKRSLTLDLATARKALLLRLQHL